MNISHAFDMLPPRLRQMARSCDILIDPYLLLAAVRDGVSEDLLIAILSMGKTWHGGPGTIEDGYASITRAIKAAISAAHGPVRATYRTASSSSYADFNPTMVVMDEAESIKPPEFPKREMTAGEVALREYMIDYDPRTMKHKFFKI